MNIRIVFLFAALLAAPPAAQAFESDVHFGLTKWLALQAGFAEAQADTIALGNQRTDAGVMDTIELVLEYACLERHADAARIAQSYHFASARQLPAPAAQRTIAAGSASARSPVDAALALAGKGKADVLLLRLGQALHLLQDSWAYQGTPDTPVFDDTGIRCDATLAWAAPAARGGWHSHRADLIGAWPADTAAMAEATYQVLTRYPAIAGVKRTAADWQTLQGQLTGLIQSVSKREQQRWFNARGIADTAFLDGTSLPDGQGRTGPAWSGRHLPALAAAASAQYGVALDTRRFFDTFFATWLDAATPGKALDGMTSLQRQRDLRTRLKIWRLKDHGAVAELAHARATLTTAQTRKVDALASKAGASVHPAHLTDAFFPLLQQGPGASPLLPFVIHALPPSDEGHERAIAVTKLRHVPYDELGFIAEKTRGNWQVVRILSAVNH